MADLVGYVSLTAAEVDPALVHRMLAACPGAAGRDQVRAGSHGVVAVRPQPFTADPLRAVATGELGRVAALLGLCAARDSGELFSDDAAALLAADRYRPETVAERLDGDYAAVLWDADRRALTLVRDALGTRPLYYHRSPQGIVFSSSLSALRAHPAVPAALTVDGMREMLAGIAVPGNTPFAGVREVRAGHALRFEPDGDREHRHWRPSTDAHPDDATTTVRQVRDLLDRAVRVRGAGGVVASLLSGGLDSSTITALYAARAAGPVRTFAVDYPGYADGYQPHIARPTPDTPYVRDMVQHLAARHTDVVLDRDRLTDQSLWSALVDVLDKPTVLADVEPSMYLLYRRIRQEADIVFGGEGADELFGGFPWFHHPEWALAPDFPWARTTDELVATLFRPAVAAWDIAEFRADEYRRAVAELPLGAGEDGAELRMRQVTYLFLTRFLPEQLDRAHRFGAALGLDVRTPFCDRALVEYVLTIPWSLQSAEGREKSVLRAAAADLLPVSVRDRRKSGYPMTRDSGYDWKLRSALGKLHADPDAPVRALIDEDVLRALHADPVGPSAPRLSRHEVELALRLDAWLRRVGLPTPK